MGLVRDKAFEAPLLHVGRYALFDEIAQGGFASIHVGRAVGAGGFARTVAIKRLHPQYAKDPEVSAMFLDEARIVARIRHPNVVPTLDLIAEDDELFIVMEYVEGVTLRFLMRDAQKRNRQIPLGVTLKILSGALHGLQAAHDARNEKGEHMELVHRDVSPDNILIGIDGLPRLLDFGVARALGQYHNTRDGEVKGKLHYITPEQVKGEKITPRSDIFSASVVLWEAMTGQRLFRAKSVAAIAHDLLTREISAPSEVSKTPRKLDGIVLQGLDRDPEKRWKTAAKMAAALEAVGELASDQAVARYVRQAGSARITERADMIAKVEAVALDIAPRDSMTSFVDAAELGTRKSGEVITASASHQLEEAAAAAIALADASKSGPHPEAPSAPDDGETSERDAPGVEVTDALPQPWLADDGNRKKAVVAVVAALALFVLLVTVGGGSDEPTAEGSPSPTAELGSKPGAKVPEPTGKPSAEPDPPPPPTAETTAATTAETAETAQPSETAAPAPKASSPETKVTPKPKPKVTPKPKPAPKGGHHLYKRD